MRRDTLALVEEATEMGLHVALSPSATPLLARMDFAEIKLSGVQRMSLSLDGATPATHDAFRGVPGTWDLTMRAMARAREVGLPIQINTTVTRDNLEEIHRFPSLLEKIQPANWSLFLVVPVGRAVGEVLPRAQEVEKLFLFLADLSTRVRYHITTTEGMHYRRVVVQQRFGLDMDPRQLPQGTGDGRGVVFISSCGDIQPSGFMPKVVGNVRHDSLLQTYQQHPLFRSLRNPGFLKGKCGRCGFNRLCGGSRARAFAATGDMFQADPLCPYLP
jgi:radical SAM protein with 4Fe4S-binding SPASM domain